MVLRREPAPVVVPLPEELTFTCCSRGPCQRWKRPSSCVLSDCYIVDVSVLVPERYPVVSARGAAVPASLWASSEVISSAILAGVVAEAASLTEVGTVTARVSVLPEPGSELPADSDEAATVYTAPVDEAVDDALDVVCLCVGQLWFQTDSGVVLPLIVDEQSMICDLVRPFRIL